MKTTVGYDVNGNKVVKIKIGSHRAFSIQSLGELPKTHRYGPDIEEIKNWIRIYGTDRQQKILQESEKKH